MIDKPGKYQISFEEYLADPCPEPSLTRSAIKSLISETPRRAFLNHPRLNPQVVEKQAEKFDIGTAAHSIFLEGIDRAIFLDVDDWRTKAAQSARNEIYQIGKIPLLAKQHKEILSMMDEAHKALAEWEGRGLEIIDGDPELSYIWQELDGLNGAWCRTRPDWTSKDRKLVIDYKTTGQSADPQEYNRIAIANGHDIQDAFYRRGIKAVEGEEPDFVFMVQEVEPPYLCAFHSLDMMAKDMGEQKVAAGIKLWEKHLRTGQWPGYGNRTYCMEAPGYATAAWELRKMLIEDSLREAV